MRADISVGYSETPLAPPVPGEWAVGRGKRAFDIIVALALLPALGPLIGLLWLAARLDGGPGFYLDRRIGRAGREFACCKIRTMVWDADWALAGYLSTDVAANYEWSTYQKLVDDPRVTSLGKLLRRTSLDELPQIFSVLVGNMSLVGPRPFMVDQRRTYDRAGGSTYYSLRPGLTGPWQVGARNGVAFVDRVRFDEEYARTASLVGDLSYLWKTAFVVLKAKGR